MKDDAKSLPPNPPSAGHALVVLAHPQPDSLCGALARSYADGLRQSGLSVEVLSLADLEFDPCLSLATEPAQELEPDLVQLRKAIEKASHVCWVFPSWWAGPPALLKGAIDRSFLPGWAYEYEGRSLPTPLLRGRSARMILTMDSPGIWYRLVHGRSVHRSFINATLKFVGFRVKSTTVFGVRTKTSDQLKRTVNHVSRVAQGDARRFRVQ